MNTKTFTNELNTGIKIGNSPIDYFILMKPRVMSLVVFTAFVGYFVGTFENFDRLNPILATIGIFANLYSFFLNRAKAQKCGGVHKKIIPKRSSDSTEMFPSIKE